jgi:hypothetical protein
MSSLTHTVPPAIAALLFVACSSGGPETVGASSAAVVSPTTTYLLPTDDGVREACRATWTNRFCDATGAQAAGDACMAGVLSAGATPACATSAEGCFQLLTTATPCAGDGPIYEAPLASSCAAPVERTCAFYSACLEAAQPCGESGYAIGYGEKYCSRYDVDDRFSPQGIAWRDAVLHCLQVSLANELPKVGTMTCDAITTFAFDSHPRCYTEGPSICFLPFSDITNVIGVIDGKDLLSLRSAKQMASVAGTCLAQIAGSISIFDAPHGREKVSSAVQDRAALQERLQFWQNIQRQGESADR